MPKPQRDDSHFGFGAGVDPFFTSQQKLCPVDLLSSVKATSIKIVSAVGENKMERRLWRRAYTVTNKSYAQEETQRALQNLLQCSRDEKLEEGAARSGKNDSRGGGEGGRKGWRDGERERKTKSLLIMLFFSWKEQKRSEMRRERERLQAGG